MIKILSSSAGGVGSIPDGGTKISHALGKKKKKKKKETLKKKTKKQYCNKLNKDKTNGPQQKS